MLGMWWIGELRTRKTKVAGSIPMAAHKIQPNKSEFDHFCKLFWSLEAIVGCN